MNDISIALRLPLAPPPEAEERLSSWLDRLALLYGITPAGLLDHCGLTAASPHELEKRLGAGEGALLMARTGLSLSTLEATTFPEIGPHAHHLIARGDRYLCPDCAVRPPVRRKDAALPWGFFCATHKIRRLALDGRAIETFFAGAVLAALDPFARRGAERMAAWAAGRDELTPPLPAVIEFLTAPHRKPSPASLDEQPKLSLEARRANRASLTQPIARQALLVIVPEYDRVAPLFAKPVRPGLEALARGSLLQNYALAVGLARLGQDPVRHAAAVLMASDSEGSERMRQALRPWPLGARRKIHALARRHLAPQAAAPSHFKGRSKARVSRIPTRSVSQ